MDDEAYYSSREYQEALALQRANAQYEALPQGLRMLVHEFGLPAVMNATQGRGIGDPVMVLNALEAERKRKQKELLETLSEADGGYAPGENPREFVGEDF